MMYWLTIILLGVIAFRFTPWPKLLDISKENFTKYPFGFYIHTQGRDWGFGYIQDGRKMFFFHNYYMGWSNLSEGHSRSNCTDHAYCPHHGAL